MVANKVVVPPLRLASASTLLAILLCATFFSGKAVRDSQARVAQARIRAETAVEELRRAERDRAALRLDPKLYMKGVRHDAEAFARESPSYARLGAPNRHRVLVDEPHDLGPGQTYSSEHLEVTAVVDKVRYQRHGATVSARHVLARIENVGDRPVAYFVRLRSRQRGHCTVRGARMHNAMALMPGERAEVVVCAGGGAIRLERLEILEITALGHAYLSRIPPTAVGYDDVRNAAHRPFEKVGACPALDHRKLGLLVREGLTRWIDVVDFFSRHNCERYDFPLGYRWAEGPLERLPALSLDEDGA